MVAPANKPGSGRGLRIASGCSTLDEFTAVFRKFCTPNSIFFATKAPRALGDEIKFAVSLKDGKTVMRGSGKVAGSYADAQNSYKRPGMVIEFKVLDAMGKILLKELNASSSKVKPLPNRDVGFEVPTLVHNPDEEDQLKAKVKAKSRGKSAVADDDEGEVTSVNPDSMDEGFDPSSMEEYVECTLVEEEAQEPEDDEDEDEDEEERTTIGPMPSDPALETTQLADTGQLQGMKPPGRPKLPGIPAIVRGDATEPGLGPSSEEETAVAAPPIEGGAVPTPIPDPPRMPAPAGAPSAVPTPIPLAAELLPAPAPRSSTPSVPSASLPGVAPVGGPTSAPPPGAPFGPAPGAPMGAAGGPAGIMGTQMGIAAMQQPPAKPFRVPSPPQGFKVPTPSEMANAIMEPLPGTPGHGAPVPGPPPGPPPGAAQAPVPGDGAPPAGMQGHEEPDDVATNVIPGGPPATGSQPPQTGNYGQAPGRASSIGPDAVGQKFPDFVAPNGPMVIADPQGTGERKLASISKGMAAGIAIACLLIGGGVGFVVGQSTSSSETAAEIEDPEVAESPPEIAVPKPVLSIDAGPAEAATETPDAALALAKAEDAGSAAATVATALDAGAEVPNTAVTPAVPDPGAPGKGECALAIAVVPSDAVITINSKKLPAGAAKVNIGCGVFSMTITHAKYKNHKGRIVVKTGRVTTLDHKLKRPIVSLKIASVPSRALVTLGGEDLGRTPINRKIPAYDPIDLKLVRSGFRPHIQTLTPEGPTKLRIKLKKKRRRGRKKRRPKIKL